jgi:hypothetical protein
MDPLHPLVPIQPAAPTPPNYNRVERIERDQQRDAQPDWGGTSQREGDAEEPLEDEYDPDWSEQAGTDTGYGPDGHLHGAGRAGELPDAEGVRTDLTAGPAAGPAADADADAYLAWDPRIHGERRREGRRQAGAEPGSPDDQLADDGDRPGPHIDISA